MHNAKQYKESMTLCDKFMADYPTGEFLPRVLFIAGENQFLQGNYPAAAPLYQKLLDKFAEQAGGDADKARLRLGWSLYFQKQYNQAIPPLEPISDKADELIQARGVVSEGELPAGAKELPGGRQGPGRLRGSGRAEGRLCGRRPVQARLDQPAPGDQRR